MGHKGSVTVTVVANVDDAPRVQALSAQNGQLGPQFFWPQVCKVFHAHNADIQLSVPRAAIT